MPRPPRAPVGCLTISSPSIWARIWASLKPVPLMAPAGQAATHVPQPWHSAGVDLDAPCGPSSKRDGVVRAQVVADAAAGAARLVDRRPGSARGPSRAAGCGPGCGPRRPRRSRHWRGCPVGRAQQPAAKTPSVIVATGSSLGCRSMIQPSELQEMPKRRATSLASARGSRPTERMTMSTGIRRCWPARVSSTWTISRPSSAASSGSRRASVTSATRPRTKMRALVQDALVELVVALARACACRCRTRRPSASGVLPDEVGELQALHAADGRAVVVVVAVAAADAVDDRHASWAR